jgi:hypothetical protein
LIDTEKLLSTKEMMQFQWYLQPKLS